MVRRLGRSTTDRLDRAAACLCFPTCRRDRHPGAVIPTALRFIQGVGVGGEWGDSALMSMEWARTHAHRGFVASWPQFGWPVGSLFANLAVLAMSRPEIEKAAGRRDRRYRAAARPASPDYRSLTFTRGSHSASAPCVTFR